MTSTTNNALASLALQGGQPVRTTPWPLRRLFGQAEKEAACRLFDQAIASGDVFGYQGVEEEAYLKQFTQWLEGTDQPKGYADAVNSGSSAVFVALRALHLKPFTEVIVPPISDPGGVMPVALLGLIPVPADSAPGSLNAGPKQIADRITPRTSAIVVAHISGHPCDMEAIMALANKHNLPVVEDCAQSHGATYHGKMTGTFGTISAFSTMSGKHHATAAQGGVVYTRDQALYYRARQAADRGKPFGIDNPQGNVIAGINLNSNELACAVGRVQLAKLPDMTRRRQAFANQVIQGTRQLKAIHIMEPLANSQSAFWFMVGYVEASKLSVDKAKVVEALKAEGIPAGAHYWHCPITFPWYTQKQVLGGSQDGNGFPWSQAPVESRRQWTANDLPNALATRDTHFTITMHENCGTQEANDVVAALTKIDAAYTR